MLFDHGFTILIHANRCLNVLHRGVECRHCIDRCPTQALDIDGRLIVCDRDSCGGCGLCLTTCPTRVFTSAQFDEETIARDVVEQNRETTEFVCGRHSRPYRDAKRTGKGALQLPGCLAMVSPGAWYEIGLQTSLEFCLEECEGCPCYSALECFGRHLRIAGDWLDAAGLPLVYECLSEGVDEATKKRLRIRQSGLKETSRREFFLRFSEAEMSITMEQRRTLRSIAISPPGASGESHAPRWMSRLAEVYRTDVDSDRTPAFWPTIEIGQDCVNCGMCSTFCPARTLRIEYEEEECRHYFTSGLCLDCRICELFCPANAISRDRQPVGRPFDRTEVSSVPMSRCTQCESLAPKTDTGLCHWCQEETRQGARLNAYIRGRLFGSTG